MLLLERLRPREENACSGAGFHLSEDRTGYSDLTIASVIFLASPSSIIVLSR